jgi:hypothetical protein
MSVATEVPQGCFAITAEEPAAARSAGVDQMASTKVDDRRRSAF